VDLTPLKSGERVYYLSDPRRTGTVRMISGPKLHVELDDGGPWIESLAALWRKL
jgi:hypothetical protein